MFLISIIFKTELVGLYVIDFCGQNKGDVHGNVFAFVHFKKEIFDWEQTSKKKTKDELQEGMICLVCFWRVRITRNNRCN